MAGYLKCFQSNIIPNSVAMTTLVDTSVCKFASTPGSEIAGSENMYPCYFDRTFGYFEENAKLISCCRYIIVYIN